MSEVKDLGPVDWDKLASLVTTLVKSAIDGTQAVRFEAGTYEGVTPSGDGLVRLDSAEPNAPGAAQGTIVGPQPNRGSRVVFAHVPPMAGYILGEVMLPAITGQLQPRVLLDSPNGQIDFYDPHGVLVGRLSSQRWWAGVEEGGSRVQLDPLSGLRVYDTTGNLVGIFDGSGIQVRDPDPDRGIVHASINPFGAVFTSDDGKQIHVVPNQSGSPVVPKWSATAAQSPGANVATPALVPFTVNDLELRFGDVYNETTLASTFTPPAGYTEIYDADDSTNGMTVAATAVRRQPHTVDAVRNIVCSQAGHLFHNGHTILVRANDTGTAPSVRSHTQAFASFNAPAMDLTLPKPSGVVAGDLLIAKVAMGNKGGFVPTSWSVPDGWLFLGAIYKDVGTTSTLASGVWYKLATATEPADYQLSVQVAGSPISTKRFHMAVIAVMNPGTLVGGSDIRFEPQSAARVYATVDQNFGTINVWGRILWGAKSYDNGNNFDLANRWYEVPAGGPYKYGFQMYTQNTAHGENFMAVVSRSTDGGANFAEISSSGVMTSPGATCPLICHDSTYLNAGDLLVVDVIQTSGTPRQIQGAGSSRCYFYVKRDIST